MNAAEAIRRTVEMTDFRATLGELRDAGARFITIFLAELAGRADLADRAEPAGPALVALLALHGDLILLKAPVGPDSRIDGLKLGDWWPAAAWPERELLERNPHLVGERSVTSPRLTSPDPDLLDRTLSGLDVFTIPFGPVRSGVFEAIQFQIETGGEDVSRLQTRPFFKHRGIQARMRGLTPAQSVAVAERVAGVASCAYASAFSEAVERAAGIEAPPQAQRWRAVLCELERMACHLDVIAKEAETTALYVGQARFQLLKETVQQLRSRLTGSRFGRGAILPGGVQTAGQLDPQGLLAEFDGLERELERDRRLFLATASMTDRLNGSGHLDRRLIEDYGAVGPLARGSGVSVDARHERPYGAYRRLGLRVVTEPEGDALARINVRFGELSESLRILRQATEQIQRQPGALTVPLPKRGSGTGCGWAEAPQGELVIWVALRDGLIGQVHIASPSLRNWPLFDHAFPNDVLTDFAFIEHSFGLTVAGADR
ncbi:MAG: NADH-quinone oxidoreductase subunit D [Solirubrobacteraceae bacterium]